MTSKSASCIYSGDSEDLRDLEGLSRKPIFNEREEFG